MTDNHFPGGVWPVMLTPFTKENKVDYRALEELIEWYRKGGVSGLFAVCQSSEMFFLSLEERVEIARFVKEKAQGLPVIASGHISDGFEDQVKELRLIGETGVDAVILITNRLARQEESDEVWLRNLELLLKELPTELKLGFYECPYPYKRVLTREMAKYCADTGRFYFLKDTSCDIENIKDKLEVCRGTNLKVYNANTATLLESLRAGAAGYSGVMANMQCRLYTKLVKEYASLEMTELSDALTICALIERQVYPVNAKFYLQQEGVRLETFCRTRDEKELNETAGKEVLMLRRITRKLEEEYGG
ncbi:MAG: dihydrodipicolinate synthase family protein [Lachnospiraceae bacterium]|nr:dihydrodipicolinate synthase family protein [Lachnospiraceae bacterium]